MATQQTSEPTRFGRVLRDWRSNRRVSQLELGLMANVSARHISFLETGRSQPSREMVLMLARSLNLPMREQNLLLLAAGFAGQFAESGLDAPALEQTRRALRYMLDKHEPWPALVLDGRWQAVMRNSAADRLLALLLPDGGPPADQPLDMLRFMTTPGLLAAVIENWEEVLIESVVRLRRERDAGAAHPDVDAFLEQIESDPAYRDVIAHSRATPAAPLVSVVFKLPQGPVAFFSTIATFGTPQDVTLQELKIECFYPADEATEQAARRALSAA